MQSLTLAVSNRAGRRWASWRGLLSGLFLTFTIAVVAFELRNLSGITMLSPLIIAIVLGMALHNTVGTPVTFKPGVVFSMRRILRFAIVLLGLQLSLAEVVTVGIVGLAIIAVTLSSTFVFTVWLGRRLGIDRKLAELLGAGTSICGASAVVATNTVTRASDEDVTYAVASVTVFGSVSVLFYPTLAGLLQLTPCLWAVDRRLDPRNRAGCRCRVPEWRRLGQFRHDRQAQPGNAAGADDIGAQLLHCKAPSDYRRR